jgi:exodeoxyribonuclease-5
VVQKFLLILEKMASFPMTENMDWLSVLRSLCAEEQLPGAGGALSCIQVISPEQAYGRSFDAAWIVNLTMESWPQRPESNPFISSEARKRIPRATEDGALAYCRRLTQGLLNCAPEVRVSWCDRINELPASASPLISHLTVSESNSVLTGTLWMICAPEAGEIRSYHNHPWLTAHQVDSGMPLDTSTSDTLRDAVSMLNFQSACPLAAYLVFRLRARMQSAPTPFHDNRLRGNLVHSTLEALYKPYLGTGNKPPASAIDVAIDIAFNEPAAGKLNLPAVIDAEKLLVRRTVAHWLDFESNLETGDLLALEWRADFRLLDMGIQVRIDRVNQMPDGRVILSDYKTGAPKSPASWGQDRLGDVQLPFYATILNKSDQFKPAGICIMTANVHEPAITGLADDEYSAGFKVSGFEHKPSTLAKGLLSWEGALNHWETGINSLVNEFLQGDARNQIFDEKALAYSGLEGLLRTSELNRWRIENGQHSVGPIEDGDAND